MRDLFVVEKLHIPLYAGNAKEIDTMECVPQHRTKYRRTRLMRGAVAAVAKSNWSHIADFQIGKEWTKRSYIIYCSNAMRIECIVSQYKIRCIYFVNTKYWRMRTISLLLQPGTIRYCQLTCIVCVVRMAWQQNRQLIRKGNLSVLIFVVIHFIGWLRFYFLSFTRSIGSR